MRIYLYVLNTLADWEIGYFTAEMNSGRYLDKSKNNAVIVKIGATKAPIHTMGGISIVPDESVDNIQFKEGDLVILPGADTWMEPGNQKIINLVPELLDKKVVVAAICGATIALANAGILNNRKHTSNDMGYLKMICQSYSGENNYLNEPAVTDENLITATGLAPLEFAYEILKRIGAMKKNTVDAWYYMHKIKEAKYFYSLMESLK